MTREFNNLFSLKDKVIVITGATGLLGKKHAEVVAAYGAIIAVDSGRSSW